MTAGSESRGRRRESLDSRNRDRGIERGYSLGSLFLLVSTSAAILALVAPVVRRVGQEVGGVSELVIAAVAGGAILAAVGMFVGMFHLTRPSGLLWGLLLGIGLGTLAGPLAFISADEFSYVLLLGFGGAALVLGLAIVSRLGGDGWHKKTIGGRRRPRAAQTPRPHPLDPDVEDDQAPRGG